MTNAQNNKRIAKNTVYLYIRMFFMMAISLYTSRVVLATLGEVDYGLYNVVGGVVTMFTIINFAMSCATSRFITFTLGKGDIKKLNVVFSTSIVIHIVIAIVILLLSETVGLWFLHTQMTIPTERMHAAEWVFQFSVFSCMVMILSVPYNALIMSHEKMGAYAYITIVEAVLKLLIVYLLVIGNYDKLILYAIFMFGVNVAIRFLYQMYCNKAFKNIRFKFVFDAKIRNEMCTYAFWSLIGSAGVILSNQGQNILLNVFFGPAVNAARGVASQVQNAIQQFSSNFQRAMTPQINISYAEGNIRYMHSLINASSKYSYYLLLLLSLPVCLEIEIVLSWWLVEVPQHTTIFIRLMLVISILTALGNPVANAAGAQGNIRNFQIAEGGVMLLIVPISYLTLKISPVPEYVFIVQIIISIIAQIVRLVIVKSMIGFSLRNYFYEVVVPGIVVTFAAATIPTIIFLLIPQNIFTFILVCILCVFSTIIAIYCVGINKAERMVVHNKIRKIIKVIA